MRRHRNVFAIGVILGLALLTGCTEDTSSLKQKIAELEKRLQKQEKELKDFASKFTLPRDFSADIQRIEDQQDRIAQAIKSKVDPVNSKLEEFREWAQEAQKERDEVKKKVKAVEDALTEVDKKYGEEGAHIGRLNKGVASNRKSIEGLTKSVADLNKGLEQLRKDLQENNNRVVEAVKKVLPKIRDAAIAEVKDRLTPLEQGLGTLKAGIENDRKAIAEMRAQGPAEANRTVQLLDRRIRELEDIMTSQKAFLLEVGSKLHDLETQLRRLSGAEGYSAPGYSRR